MSSALQVTVPDGVPFIDFTREFDYPVADVYRAHASAELMSQWLGPRDLEMEVGRFDFRPGGGYEYTHVAPTGDRYEFRGTFHTVRENDKVIQTFEFLGFPDVVSIETLTFEDLGDGRTRLSGHAVYPTVEARDGMASSGMEEGMKQGYEQLDELLAKSAA
ncbi:SRPBCC family protein [Brevibacterium daeguense]|uniref:SRPBCC family protein n=1 Tax=Brevibacterium daeguense TaxID=909936 RepID=A0ABP8EIG8_9MICO|nr:SRPBCC family protein [Brevibacterium daeguense]